MHSVTLDPPVMIRGQVIDKQTRKPIKKFRLVGIAVVECGVNQRCAESFGRVELKTAGDYVFQSGELYETYHVSCSADGYKSASSRPITPDEDEVVWDFELEREEKGKQ
jgi:hypothetical protein